MTWPSGRPATWRDASFFWRLLGSLRPQLVMASFFSVHLSMWLGRLRRVPRRVAWYRVLHAQDRLDTRRGAFVQRMVELARWLSYRLASHAVAVSPVGAVDLQRQYGVAAAKVQVFHTCRADPLALLGTDGATPGDDGGGQAWRILCVGRLVRSKGQDVLIRAVAQLAAQAPGQALELDLVGTGPLEQEYRQLVAAHGLTGQVRFLGALPQVEVFRRMAAAHVLAAPFRSDPGPGVIAEALGCGLPVVMAETGGMPGLIGSHPALTWVQQDRPEALAGALYELLADPQQRAARGQAARALFLQRFHLDHWLAGVSGWLLALVGAAAPQANPTAVQSPP